MTTAVSNRIVRRPVMESARRWGLYCLKAAFLLGLLFLLARLLPTMPTYAVAICWAVLSAAIMTGSVYRATIRKTYRQVRYQKGGVLARVNNGRILSIVVGFVLSAVCSAGLIMNAPEWGIAEWVFIAVSIPLYLVVFVLVGKRIRREYTADYRLKGCLTWSYWTVVVLLVILYVVATFGRPAPTYGSAAEAFLAAKNPLEGSSSVLLSDSGRLLSFVDGMKMYGESVADHEKPGIYHVVVLLMACATFSGVAGLLRVASIDFGELKRAFAPLPEDGQGVAALRIRKSYVVVAAVMPVILIAASVFADHWMTQVASTRGYTMAERFVRDKMNLTVYVIDGKYYDRQGVDEILRTTGRKVAKLSEENKSELRKLINKSFDKRLDNVDGYLDWYYSLPADYGRLAGMITGSTEDFVAGQFTKKIENGIDDSAIDKRMKNFSAQIDRYRSQAERRIDSCELDGVPAWMVETKEKLDGDFLSESLKPASHLLDVKSRLAVSGSAGLAAGVLARATTKPFFSTLVDQISKKLLSRAAGSAAGGSAGTILAGPLGTAAGIAAGAAVGMGVDALLLNIDERQHRDEYKAEIVQSIEGQRSEVLASLR